MAFLARATCSSSKAGSSSPTPARSVSAPDSAPQGPAASVRTLVVGSSRCSVCKVVELRGRQTVGSAACRRERSRRRAAQRWREIAALLEASLRKLEEGSP